jgi:hypothetical protein
MSGSSGAATSGFPEGTDNSMKLVHDVYLFFFSFFSY